MGRIAKPAQLLATFIHIPHRPQPRSLLMLCMVHIADMNMTWLGMSPAEARMATAKMCKGIKKRHLKAPVQLALHCNRMEKQLQTGRTCRIVFIEAQPLVMEL